MTTSQDEVERRRNKAAQAIRRAYDSGNEEVNLFVSHHLSELDDAYWIKHCGLANPKPDQILDILIFQSHWSDDEEAESLDNFDFTLPDDVSHYVLCVSFNQSGEISRVVMES